MKALILDLFIRLKGCKLLIGNRKQPQIHLICALIKVDVTADAFDGKEFLICLLFLDLHFCFEAICFSIENREKEGADLFYILGEVGRPASAQDGEI